MPTGPLGGSFPFYSCSPFSFAPKGILSRYISRRIYLKDPSRPLAQTVLQRISKPGLPIEEIYEASFQRSKLQSIRNLAKDNPSLKINHLVEFFPFLQI
jgi:hypothetical protein